MADSKYTWDFSLLYNSKDEIQKDIEKFKTQIKQIKSFEGKLNTKNGILGYLVLVEDMMKSISRLDLYASMKVDQNSVDSANLKLQEEISNLITIYSVETAFVGPELGKNSDEFLLALQNDPSLLAYDRFFESIIKEKKHTISKDKEALIAGMGDFTDFSELFEKLTNLEIKFEEIETNKGEKFELNNSSYGLYTKHEDAGIRAQAHEKLHKAYSEFNYTLSQNYISYLKMKDFVAKTYNFKSTFDKALFNEEVDNAVYDKLVLNIHKNLDKYQNYLKTKSRVLKLKDFKVSDVYAPVGNGNSFKLEYEDAVKVVLDVAKILGDEYCQIALKGFNSRWVDVFPQKGKRSGAYSASAQTGNPFMLLNYHKTYNDISTIAHELGHSMHSYFSEKNQPYFKQNYVIFVAEVASTVNEVLLANKLMRETKDPAERKFIAENLLSEFSASVFRQTMFSEFEYYAHDQINKGNPLSFEELNEKYGELQKLYFGDVVKLHDYAKFEWSRIPHFYRAFYVYKYATGFISAVSIASQIEEMGAEYVKNHYLRFLSSGCSADPVTLLKLANVDISTDEPYLKAFHYYDQLIEILNN